MASNKRITLKRYVAPESGQADAPASPAVSQNGPANGTLLFLPIDQGLEHGPRDFFPNPDERRPGV